MKMLRPLKAFYAFLKSVILNFVSNQDSFKAAALSYYSFTSIVPFLAILFGIANELGLQEFLEKQLRGAFSGQQEVIGYIIEFSLKMLKNTKGGIIAIFGFIMLLWTTFSILSNIEESLNLILNIKKERDYKNQLIAYPPLMIICPLLFIAASTINVYLATELQNFSAQFAIIKYASPLLKLLVDLFPFILSILLFIIVYVFVPAKVEFNSARVFAGIITGVIFQLWQLAYIEFQGKITSYGVVYGSFAALPLFLLWVQISWLIVLIGAEICAYFENSKEKTA